MKVYLVVKDAEALNGDEWADAYGVFATMELADEYVQKTMEETGEPPEIIITELIGS